MESNITAILHTAEEVELARTAARKDFLDRIALVGFTVTPEFQQKWWPAREVLTNLRTA